ncbi:folate family ECF transporter S component [Limosilactobacillus sp.]|uniref:folate family ECF transporter S component n=1 Tax=Limosilactobacillus sp. TaxID=2773925 RepID=UPI00345E2CEA
MDASQSKVRELAMLGLLTALQIILGNMLSLQLYTHKIVFTFIVIALTARLFTPWATAISSALAGLLGMVIFPKFAFFPGFILTYFCVGLLFGYCLQNKVTLLRIVIACLLTFFGFYYLMNSMWLHMMYGISYKVLLTTRLPQEIVMFIVAVVILSIIFRIPIVERLINRYEMKH